MSLSQDDVNDLRYAKDLLENPSLAAKLTNFIGKPLEQGFELLPKKVSEIVTDATQKSLETALDFAVMTLDEGHGQQSANLAHKLLVAAAGAGAGALGLPALAVELPVSTTIMLRSIAEIARSEGEQLKIPETKLACLEVFALGGHSKADDAVESAYFAVRVALARALAEAAEHLAKKGLTQRGAPALVRFITRVAARFGIAVSEKAAAQAIPIIGAVGGALINTMFIDHFQDMAHGHFIVRRLERTYDPELVKSEYLKL